MRGPSMRFRLSPVIFLLPALILGLWFSSGGTAAAKTHPHYGCNTNDGVWYFDNNTILVQIAANNAGCQSGDIAQAYLLIANCSSSTNRSINADEWQTRQPYPGGKRYSDTGRSGFITYAPNCLYYTARLSRVGNNGLASPAYACAWVAFDNWGGESHDYLCTQFPPLT